MLEIITTIAPWYAGALLLATLLALAGPAKWRESAKWVAIALASCGAGGALWVLERQAKQRAATIATTPDEAAHDATDATLAAIAADSRKAGAAIDAVDAAGWTDTELGSDMAAALAEDQDENTK